MSTQEEPVEIGVKDLIPTYWKLEADLEEDLLFWGKVTLDQALQSARQRFEGLKSSQQRDEKLLEEILDLDADKVRELAKQYELPQMRIETPRDGYGPEPVDGASINRREGATTFNICGWCKYVGCGTCRYGVHLSATCDLLRLNGDETNVKFDTPCKLVDLPGSEFASMRVRVREQIRKHIALQRIVEGSVLKLTQLVGRAESKPALPAHRPYDWFDAGDQLVCYVGSWEERIDKDVKFAEAIGVLGYRHHDGCISVEYTKRLHASEVNDGRNGGFGMGRPEVMHKWEFEYLLQHPDFAALYAGPGTGAVPNFNRDAFLAAMAAEAGRRRSNITPSTGSCDS